MRFALVLFAVLFVACAGPIGPEGPAGPTGATGPQGPAGPKGQTVASNTFCNGTTPSASGTGFFGFTYQVVTYTNGDVWVSCVVQGGADQSSVARHYTAGQTGASIGGCAVVFDTNDSSGGIWVFRNDAPGMRVTCVDPGSPLNGRVIPLTNCF